MLYSFDALNGGTNTSQNPNNEFQNNDHTNNLTVNQRASLFPTHFNNGSTSLPHTSNSLVQTYPKPSNLGLHVFPPVYMNSTVSGTETDLGSGKSIMPTSHDTTSQFEHSAPLVSAPSNNHSNNNSINSQFVSDKHNQNYKINGVSTSAFVEGLPLANSPASPICYTNDTHSTISRRSVHTTNNTRRPSLIYPLTPQTNSSRQGASPMDTASYLHDSNSHLKNYGVRKGASDYYGYSHPQTQHSYQQQQHEQRQHRQQQQSTETMKLFYHVASRSYVYMSEREAEDGLIRKELIRHDMQKNRKVTKNNKSNRGRRMEKRNNNEENNDDDHEEVEEDEDDDEDGDEDDDDDDDGSDNHSEATEGDTDVNSLAHGAKSKRSRTGCLTCRQRKKRCCETKPICAECERLSIKCRWPVPGSERKNKSKNQPRISHDEMYHEVYGVIKVLRGVVEYKIEE